jgi:Mn-dependent DtxR family transcriptional regulator
MLGESLSEKLEAVTMQNAVPPSLQERVRSYMTYKCENGKLRGVENAAFHLHCSPRQLQRILNQLSREGIVKKTGKGTYELCEKAPSV